ncbi:MAG: hypothetical protein J1F23_01330 [Oscillospiraceae bacterium]|nr:hypothetical protein [Oscillospiraceae bacterium]
MRKKVILFTGLSVAFAVIILIFVCNAALQKDPINKFKKYLEQNNYSCSKYTCTMQSERVEDDITETYSEIYQFKEHTFTAIWIHYDSSNTATWQMEFIYNYADDTVTMNRYETADSLKAQEPDTVYHMNNEEMLECEKGDLIASESELYNQMLSFKNVFAGHLEEADINIQDITL